MDEYQLSDLVASFTSLTYMNDAAFLTITSAYIGVAYIIGAKLTRFQVSFLTFLFVGLQVPATLANLGYISRIFSLLDQLGHLDSSAEARSGDDGMVTAAYFVFRFLVVLGSLVFMWQVRHGVKDGDAHNK